MKKGNHKFFISILVAIVLLVSAVFTFSSKNLWQKFMRSTDATASAVGDIIESEAAKQPLGVHFIDVGQGDSTLIRFENYNILIDCAKKAEAQNVYYYLEQLNIDHLDLAIATHPDADHIGGFAELINNAKPDLFLLPQLPTSIKKTQTEMTLINTLKTMKVKTEYAVNAKEYRFGDLLLTTYLTAQEHSDKNDYSVITHIRYKNATYLFMGDAGKTVEKELMKDKAPIQADVLKAGHHGSSKSSAANFVKYVHPRYCIFSCGLNNDYGHPHNEVLEIMKKQIIEYYRTDENGTVVIGTDGSKYIIATEKAAA
ncbi:MAG: MBL fold metallo-hydrolase [Ruminococcaceae bacterium]|nr:MBL fold metallo-hydrolase [Oscillospiraceae bacterium]